jgi:trans-aconitate 2-methyltransferase
VAADASRSMLAEARRRLAPFGDRVCFRQVDLEGDVVGGLDGLTPFDAIVSTGTFHWIRDHRAMYEQLAAILRPGGSLVAQCGGDGSIAEVRAILDELGIDWRSFNRYAAAEDSARWLTEAGFVDVETWLTVEPVTFDTRAELVEYLHGGALAPYLGSLPVDEQRTVCAQVAARLGTLGIEFVRLNLLARRGAVPQRT